MYSSFRRAFTGAGVLALAWLFLASPAQSQVRVVAFGDSNTYGMNMAREQSYPAQLETMLKAKGLNVRVDNQGIPGDTASGGLARVDSAVPAGTRVAIVLFGVNDMRRGVPPATFEQNLSEIVARLKARGVRVVLCYRHHPQMTGEWKDVSLRIGKKHQAAPCNFREGVPASGYAGDGHENAAGNTQVAKNLMRIVEPLVR
jgi:lysophospholipase L1-like esterase